MTRENEPKTQDPRPKTKDQTILVTGGCGFVGSNLVEFLLENTDYNIRILDNLSVGDTKYVKEITGKFEDVALTSPSRTKDQRPNTQDLEPTQQLNNSTTKPRKVIVIQGDIRDKEDAERATTDVDAAVNLAAITGVPISLEKPEETFQVNVNGTQTLLEACRKNEVKKFILASSNAAVGDKEPPMHENMVPEPISPYGASKLSGEALCKSYSASFEVDANALRFANVYGPYSDHKNSVVMKFMRRAQEGKELKIYGDGHQTRDFIHARDIARGVLLTLQPDVSGEVFQIGTREETEILDLAQRIKELADKSNRTSPKVVHDDPRQGDIYRNYTDYSKAKEILGFEPEVETAVGLKELWRNYLDENRSK